jgi:hypothetical protein
MFTQTAKKEARLAIPTCVFPYCERSSAAEICCRAFSIGLNVDDYRKFEPYFSHDHGDLVRNEPRNGCPNEQPAKQPISNAHKQSH